MATTDAQHLTEIDARITALNAAHASSDMQSYTTPDGRSFTRGEYAKELDTLFAIRRQLQADIRADTSRSASRVRVAKLGSAGRSA